MVSANERYSDSEESGSTGESILVVMLVAEDVIDSAETSDCSRNCQCTEPHSTNVDAAILGSIGLKSDRAQFIAGSSAKEEKPCAERGEQRDDNREVCRGPMERLNELRQPRDCAGVNFRRVQRFRNVKMIRDNPVEEREDDEVEHDRDDHFVRAE